MERFWSKVDKTQDCWNWTASLSDRGYGLFRFDGKTSRAHRVSYILAFGSIGGDLVIDHLCKNRRCVNPDHLELVSQAENIMRGLSGKENNSQLKKTQCPRGHEYTRITKNGHRLCGKCRSMQTMKSRYKKTIA